MGMRHLIIRCCLALWLALFLAGNLSAQKINRFMTNDMELLYFGKRYSYIMPHVVRTFHNALGFHKDHWDYAQDKTYVLLTDFEDDGHGGAMVMPKNTVVLG
ncbi:MAG: hypothetical protein ACLFPE_12520, partial [Bacteroidales bacterium]